ncbi:MAG: hypothetical protein H6R15_3042, partial [Proteobacteria bacterium]|nr:hypothetical protein [Pseudomonadota bacterium]
MDKIPTQLRCIWALWFVLLCVIAGDALALPGRGIQLNNWCALRPVQAAPPQQSRPYQAAGSSCSICHNTGNPSGNDLNTLGNAAASCSGNGTATVCGAAVNPFCIATPPANASITAPPVGTSVAQGQSLTYTGAIGSNPDGFPLAYTWQFTGGLPNATGQSVAVPMTVTGTVTATLQVRNSVGMLASGATPTRAVTVTAGTNQAPLATINSPAANVTITQGASVNFTGSGSDPDNNLPLTYSWSFPGGTPASSTAQNPGAVTYNTAGTFTASFTVRDSLGLASTVVTRTVTVTPVANQAPLATINSPAANVTIAQGASVNFTGSGSDPDNNLP